MELQSIAAIVNTLGLGNTALLIILALFCYFFVQILPKAVERIVKAIENLGVTFATHDTRAIALQQSVLSLTADVKTLNDKVATKTDVESIHSKMDLHQQDCQRRSTHLMHDILEGRNKNENSNIAAD